MSEQEILQTVNEALVPVFQSGDMIAVVDDDAVWESLASVVEPDAKIRFLTPDGGSMGTMGQSFRGAEGMRAGWREWLGPWQTYQIEGEEVLEASGGRVLALVSTRGRLRGSGAEIAQEAAAISRVEAGRIVAIDFYLDHDQARRDAGLI